MTSTPHPALLTGLYLLTGVAAVAISLSVFWLAVQLTAFLSGGFTTLVILLLAAVALGLVGFLRLTRVQS
jgi:hypothetical protein